VQFAAAHTAVISIVVVVTLYWKISVHAAGAASLATLVSALLEAKLLAVLPVPVLVVSWSRLYLGRHTLAQVVAGGILGAVVFGSFLLVR
jgi:membrane-associated phospholipid phosphatase